MSNVRLYRTNGAKPLFLRFHTKGTCHGLYLNGIAKGSSCTMSFQIGNCLGIYLSHFNGPVYYLYLALYSRSCIANLHRTVIVHGSTFNHGVNHISILYRVI